MDALRRMGLAHAARESAGAEQERKRAREAAAERVGKRVRAVQAAKEAESEVVAEAAPAPPRLVLHQRQSAAFEDWEAATGGGVRRCGSSPLAPSGEDVKVFSMQRKTGSRVFTTASLEGFWAAYVSARLGDRHWYEIVREDTPCLLYFDLEFDLVRNPGVDGAALVTYLIHRLSAFLFELYGVALCRRDVLDLDSTSGVKFSRHLIVHTLGGHRFRDVEHVRQFVYSFVGRLAGEREWNPRADALWLADKRGDRVCIVDTGVYTKNRAMRLYLSCKAGKAATLLPSLDNQFGMPLTRAPHPGAPGDVSVGKATVQKEAVVALPSASFIAAGNEWAFQLKGHREVVVGDDAFCRHILHASFITTTLPPLGGGDCQPWAHPTLHTPLMYMPALFGRGGAPTSSPIAPAPAPSSGVGAGCARTRIPLSGHPEGHTRTVPSSVVTWGPTGAAGNSPFPALEAWVVELASRNGGPEPSVRAWRTSTLVLSVVKPGDAEATPVEVITRIAFDMCRNRYCHRIQRPHKSNNVVWTVDLLGGVAVQTCHDVECSGFRSAAVHAPVRVLPTQLPPGSVIVNTP